MADVSYPSKYDIACSIQKMNLDAGIARISGKPYKFTSNIKA